MGRTSLRSALPWFGALLVLCYAPVLRLLVIQWNQDPDMGHGFFVPLAAALLAWQRRERLAGLPVRHSWWGLALVGWAGVQLLLACIGVELFLARTAFIFSIAGIVLFLYGTAYLRVLAFPIALLLLMVPIPAIVFNQITLPLQFLASAAGEHLIRLAGVPAQRLGNVLVVSGHQLLVAEACSGIRSLLSLAFLALAYGAFAERGRVIRALLFAATVPIALAANAVRVALAGVLTSFNPKLAEGFLHEASGWLIFVMSMLLLLALDWALRRARRRPVTDPGGNPA